MIFRAFSSSHDLVAGVRFRLFLRLWLHTALTLFVPALLLYGCGVLVLRFWGNPWLLAGWTPLVGSAVLIGWSARRAWNRTPDRTGICAYLDRVYRRGGMWMTGEERELGSWSDRLGTLALPAIRWRGLRRSSWFLAASLFSAVCWIVPQPMLSSSDVSGLAIGEQVAELAQRIDLEAELELIPEPAAEQYRETLGEIESHAAGRDPARTWESLDQLGKTLDEVSASGAEAALDAYRDAMSLKAVSEMMERRLEDSASPQSDRALTDQAMAELSSLTRKLAGEHPQLTEKLQALLDAVKNRAMDPADLARLNALLAETSTTLEARLAELAGHRFVDPETLRKLKELGDSGMLAADLEAFLENQQQEGGACAALMACAGQGGIGRGRGDAEMTWASEPSEERGKFEPMALPPTAVESDSGNSLVGMTFTAPTAQPDATGAGGALRRETGKGGGSYRHTVLPRHRAAVRRYFHTDRDAGNR